MQLLEYFKLKRGNHAKMARSLHISYEHLYSVSRKLKEPSPRLAYRIEEYTRGKVSRWELLANAIEVWGVPPDGKN